jgi:hypothetical protein
VPDQEEPGDTRPGSRSARSSSSRPALRNSKGHPAPAPPRRSAYRGNSACGRPGCPRSPSARFLPLPLRAAQDCGSGQAGEALRISQGRPFGSLRAGPSVSRVSGAQVYQQTHKARMERAPKARVGCMRCWTALTLSAASAFRLPHYFPLEGVRGFVS